MEGTLIALHLAVVTCCFVFIEGYPNGAPDKACVDFAPRHLSNQATGPVPYFVNLSTIGFSYVPRKHYTIQIKGTQRDNNFRGFLIQATTCADGTPIGFFGPPTYIGSNETYKQACVNNTGATHVSRSDKTYVDLLWVAPLPSDSGCIRFRYTFVDVHNQSSSESRFWTNKLTDKIIEEPCPFRGQIRKFVAFRYSCQTTCQNTFHVASNCSRRIVVDYVCECPNEMIFDEDKNECVPLNECLVEPCAVKGQIRYSYAEHPLCQVKCSDRYVFRISLCSYPSLISDRKTICACPFGMIIDDMKNECVNQDECTPVKCPNKGQYFTSGCSRQPTCNYPNFELRLICDGSTTCACPYGEVLDEEASTCVNKTECFSYISLSRGEYYVEENSGYVIIKIVSSKAKLVPFEVELKIAEDSATEDDFEFNTTSPLLVKFEANVTEISVNITIKDNEEVELHRYKRFTAEVLVPDNLYIIGVYPGIYNTNATVQIYNDDTATIEFTQSEFSVYENESQLIVTVHLSAHSAPVAYPFDVVVIAFPNTAEGNDFIQTLDSYFVKFEARQLQGNTSIDIINDNELEPTEEIFLFLLPGWVFGAGLQIFQDEAIGRILNDDRVYVGWFPTMAMVKEGDQFMISLVLDRKPGINFTVSIIVTNVNTSDSDYTIDPYSVTFNSSEEMKGICILPKRDTLLESIEKFQLQFEIASDAKELGVMPNSSNSVATIMILNADEVCEVHQINGNVTYNESSKTATLVFSVVDEVATAKCRLNRGHFTNCTSPVIYTNIGQGRHTITVKVTCPDGGDKDSKRFKFRAR